ncbi:MAG: hypothetical protein IKY27_10290 [Bacteroidales bacterium]|nr:hypothetical protein [Bacteroidales bacterium]
MTFDVAANYQTICANNNEFDYYYNYPILGAGISVSRFSEFVMEEGSFLPDVYTVYGSFERKLYNDNKYNLGFILNLGFAIKAHSFDAEYFEFSFGLRY